MPVREQIDFADLVQDALRHLNDPVRLQAHPLAALTGGASAVPGDRDAASTRGRRLHQELVRAIESFRPAAANGLTKRRQQVLALRYVDGLDASAVADRLGIGRSQYYHEHRGALMAMVSLLDERWHSSAARPASSPVPDPTLRARRLPTPLTSFIGRERSVAAVRGHLATGRLVTLTGPPGTGKTRLALAVAHVLAADSLAQPQLADGVWFIALAAVVDQAMVIPAIVDALGAAELPGASSLAILCAHLRDRRLLLVLDNFEHVVGAAPALSELLMACPGVRALVTSRAALRILGEQEWPVPPLALPDPTQVPSADQLGHYEAIALFVDRAQAIRPTFDLTLENAPAVAEICRRLDGLPLAIELAAARVRVLTAPQIAARLDGNLRLIESEEVGAQPRQRTLRAAMDWSYGLLAPDERTLLGRLAVFAGGWTLEAADEVCDGDALELTTALVDHSLVDVEMGEPPRYRLLEMVRQYAEAKLELAGDVASIRDRHLRWCLALCDRTRPQDADPARVAEVARELPNLRAALRWAVASDQVEVGFRIVNGLSGFWYARGQYAEGREWVAALLAAPGGRSCTAARASALRTAGHLALQQCDFAAAERYQEEAAAIAAELGDQEGLASTMQMRARLAAARGDLPTAQRLFREVVATEERLGRPTWLLFGLVGLADAVTELGDAPDQASRLAERALTLARELRSQQGQAMALRSLGRAAARTRDLEAARSWLHQALEVERALNNRRATAQLLVDLADLAAATPDQEEARRLYKEGVRTAAEVRSWPEIGYCLEGLAALLADAEPRRAIVLAIAADDLLTRTGVPLSTERSTRRAVWSAAARRRVGDDSFRAAEQDGLALTLDGMLELAVVR